MKGAAERIGQSAAVGIVFVEHCDGRWSAQPGLRREVGERDSVEGVARYDAEHPARDAGEVGGGGARRNRGQLPIVNGGGGQHAGRVHVTDDCRDGGGRHEILRDFCGRGTVTVVIPRNHPELMTVDAAGLVDLFDCELHALQILKPVTLLPGPGSSHYVRRLAPGACREREQRD